MAKPAFTGGRRSGVESEATKFKNELTLFVNRYESIPTPSEVGDDHDHICIQTSCGPEFWGSLRLGSTALAASMLKQVDELLKAGYSITIDVAIMHSYGLVQMTQRLRRSWPKQFCLLITIKMSEPDLGGWAVKVEPGNMFTPYQNETGVYVGSSELLKEKGFTSWLEHGNG